MDELKELVHVGTVRIETTGAMTEEFSVTGIMNGTVTAAIATFHTTWVDTYNNENMGNAQDLTIIETGYADSVDDDTAYDIKLVTFTHEGTRRIEVWFPKAGVKHS